MTVPLRFVVTTYNIWGGTRWPEREQPLREYLRSAQPDILALQELRPETLQVLREELPGHQHVDDPFVGWTHEGNILWSTAMFELVTHGAEPVGIEKLNDQRRMFWVRLRVKERGGTLLIANAHYTYQSHPQEQATGFSPRPEQGRQTVAALDRLAEHNEPVIFVGDLNDPVAVAGIFSEAGFFNSYMDLGTAPRPTWPAAPTARGRRDDGRPHTTQVLDWQWRRGPVRAMNCDVPDFYFGDLAPSDHKPLTVTYGMD